MAVFILALLLAISYGARDVSGQQDKLLQNVRNIGTDVKTILRMLVEERKHKTVRGMNRHDTSIIIHVLVFKLFS